MARRLGIKAAGNSLHAERRAVINEGIDLRLKALHGRNVLWFATSGAAADVTFTADDATATIVAPGFLYPITLHVRDGTEDKPMAIIDHRRYQEIPDKTRTGRPCQAFFDGETAYLYPVPDIGYVGKMTYQRTAADSSDAEAVDMESAAMLAFVNIVALDLADEFDVDEERIRRWREDQQDWLSDIYAAGAQRADTPPDTPEYF